MDLAVPKGLPFCPSWAWQQHLPHALTDHMKKGI